MRFFGVFVGWFFVFSGGRADTRSMFWAGCRSGSVVLEGGGGPEVMRELTGGAGWGGGAQVVTGGGHRC